MAVAGGGLVVGILQDTLPSNRDGFKPNRVRTCQDSGYSFTSHGRDFIRSHPGLEFLICRTAMPFGAHS